MRALNAIYSPFQHFHNFYKQTQSEQRPVLKVLVGFTLSTLHGSASLPWVPPGGLHGEAGGFRCRQYLSDLISTITKQKRWVGLKYKLMISFFLVESRWKGKKFDVSQCHWKNPNSGTHDACILFQAVLHRLNAFFVVQGETFWWPESATDRSVENYEKFKQKKEQKYQPLAFGLMTRTEHWILFLDTRRGLLAGKVTDPQDSVTCLHWGLYHVLWGALESQKAPFETVPEMEAGKTGLVQSPVPPKGLLPKIASEQKLKLFCTLLITTLCTTLRIKPNLLTRTPTTSPRSPGSSDTQGASSLGAPLSLQLFGASPHCLHDRLLLTQSSLFPSHFFSIWSHPCICFLLCLPLPPAP